MPMMSVMPLEVPSTTPVWSEENSSGQAIGVGAASRLRISSCGRSASTVRILRPVTSCGVSMRRWVLARLRQPPVLPIVMMRIAPPESSSAMSRIMRVSSPSVSTASATRSSRMR